MDIYNKIETLYSEQKSKGFITHLLRSFFPLGKATEVYTRPKGKVMKCCITGVVLSSKEEKIESTLSHNDLIVKHSIERIKNVLSPEEFTPSDEFLKAVEDVKSMRVAVSSPDSDKLISEEAYKELYNFFVNQILRGEKTITWVANNQRAKETIAQVENQGTTFTSKERKVAQKIVETQGNTRGMSLGDLDVLKSLRDKFKD
jgi:hypothetical protein